MKFEIATNKFAEVINKAEKLTSKKTALPILSNLYLEITSENLLIVRSTNLELGFESRLKVSDSEAGKAIVDASMLKNFLQQIRNSQILRVETLNNSLLLDCKISKAEIACNSSEEYPSLPLLAQENTVNLTIEATKFISGVNSVWYAAASSTMKPELSSIYIHTHNNELYFVATDTFRLAEKIVSGISGVEIGSLLIPQQNALEITKIIDESGSLDLSFDDNLLTIKQGETLITVRVIDGTFPDYRQIIPQEFETEATILHYDFENALRLSSIFADKYYQVTMTFNPDNIQVDSKGTDQGRSSTEISASVDGDNFNSKFNQRYLTEPLNTLKGDNLVLRVSPNKPMIIHNPSDTTFKYLVMPMHQ